jgi:NRPS condensation-like uncharacterized protein
MTPKIPSRFPAVSSDRTQYLTQQITEPQLHFVVVLAGRLDENRLKVALRRAMDAEPVFGCRYVEGRRPYWQRREDLDGLSLCEVIESRDVPRELAEFRSRPCNPSVDPLLQTCILRGATDTLCLKVSHCVADDTGGKDLLNLVASIYRGLGDDPDYRVTPNLGSRSFFQLFRHIGLGKSLSICWKFLGKSIPRLPRDQTTWRIPSSVVEDRGAVKYAMRRLGPERFEEVRAYAKTRGATLNDVFVAAFFRALCGYLDPHIQSPQKVFLPISLRRLLPSGKTEAICNFFTVLGISLDRLPEESFASTLGRVKDASKLSPERVDRALFVVMTIAVVARLFLPRVKKRIRDTQRENLKKGRTTAVFSNLGVLEPDRMDFGVPVADAYRIVVPAAPPGLFLAVVSFRKTLTFMVSYCSGVMTPEVVEGFLDQFMRQLPTTQLPTAQLPAAAEPETAAAFAMGGTGA